MKAVAQAVASTFMTLASLEAELEAVLESEEAEEIADEKTRRGTGGNTITYLVSYSHPLDAATGGQGGRLARLRRA